MLRRSVVFQLTQHPTFTNEQLKPLLGLGEIDTDQLDRDSLFCSPMLRPVDTRHSTGTDKLFDQVGTDRLAGPTDVAGVASSAERDHLEVGGASGSAASIVSARGSIGSPFAGKLGVARVYSTVQTPDRFRLCRIESAVNALSHGDLAILLA